MSELNQETKIDLKTVIILVAFVAQTAINYAVNNSNIEYLREENRKTDVKLEKFIDKVEIKIDKIHEEISKR